MADFAAPASSGRLDAKRAARLLLRRMPISDDSATCLIVLSACMCLPLYGTFW
jgi:hypothetical protein